YNVPTKAILWQAVWSSILCFSGTYKDLFEYVVFALVIFFAGTGLAVIVLRFKQPKIPRPYKTWGYPVLPVFFVLINLAIFLNTVWAQPIKSLVGLIILAVGIPAFLYWKAKARKEQL
ncbi:MAG: amino acid permease, partial [Candidatus Aminicenantes bacterium]|nr:amino acid permease [Candidatus Aminicenantes bacterium]